MNPSSLDTVVGLAESSLVLAAAVALPVLGALALVGLLTSLLQAATQVQDPSVAHFPRLLVGLLVLGTLGPWMGSQVTAFALRCWSLQ